MADESQSDASRWDGSVQAMPDPQAVGPANMAWYALHGALEGGPGEAGDTIAWAAGLIAGRLGAFGPGTVNPLSPAKARIAIREAQLLLGYVAEIFDRQRTPVDGEAAFAFKAELKRQRGRPAKSAILPRSLAWWGVACEVEALMNANPKLMQKVAVGQVASRLGLKDAVVAGWCRERRKCLERSSWLAGDADK